MKNKNLPPPIPGSKPSVGATVKKVVRYTLMGLGGLFIFAIVLTMAFWEDPATAAQAPATTTTTTVKAAPATTTTTVAPVTTTTVPRVTTTTVYQLSRSDMRTGWLYLVEQESLSYPSLTWADRLEDSGNLSVLDTVCGAFADGTIDPNDDASISTFVVYFQYTEAPDWWTTTDSLLLSFAIGAASYPGICP